MIKHISLDHSGGYYFYRIHNHKIAQLCNNLTSLRVYLNNIFSDCPHDYFNTGPRSSGLRFTFNNLKLHQIGGHEVSKLTENALLYYGNRYKAPHSQVQVFMLEKDNKTIAVEVPIWLEPDELKEFTKIFRSKLPLTGHIDILRIEDGKVWVWDYKPAAKQEKYAATQVYFYALMLSKRTNINLKEFRCGYFDEKDAFIFQPKLEFLKKKPLLRFLQ